MSENEIQKDTVTVDSYLVKKEDENKPHTIYTTGGERYSTFKDDPIPDEGVSEGDQVEITWYSDGDYRTITDVEIVADSGNGGSRKGNREGQMTSSRDDSGNPDESGSAAATETERDGRRIRSVALKAAVTCALDEDSTEGIIDRAHRFEQYLRGEDR